MKKKGSWLISTASEKHERDEDIYIEVHDMESRVKEDVFVELF
jgi:hypothetical protein